MKRALLIFTAFISAAVTSLAQVTDITVETFYTDDGTVAGYPAGHTTYRVYANTTSATDRVAVVFGGDISPLVLNVSGSGVWNLGSAVAGDNYPCSIYAIQPLAEYDSYVTVGYSCDDDGGLPGVYKLEDSTQPWQSVFQTAPYGGNNVLMSTPVGGTWFLTTDNNHGDAGADNKVLLAQITTDGDVCGIFNLTVFPDYSGAGSNSIDQTGLQFGNIDCGTPGCTDDTALNFDADADFDNGLCLYECSLDFDVVVSQAPTCASNNDGWIYFSGMGNQSYIEYSIDGVIVDLEADTIFGLSNGTHVISMSDTRFDNESLNPGGIYGDCVVSQDVIFNTEALFLTASAVTGITCHNANDGCVDTDIANYGGGTGELTFMIYTNAGTPVLDGSGDTLMLEEPSYCGLAGGTYHFMVMDENGCTFNGPNFVIVNPGQLTLFEGAESAASCFNSPDATQVITWGGGVGDVDFSLDADDDTYEIEGNPSNAVISGILPGSHTLYAVDANGCTASFTFTVAGGPAIVTTPTITEPLCNGDDNGMIELSATGGTGTKTFSFDGIDFSSENTLDNLSAGTVTVYVMDANDCVDTLDVEVTEPEMLMATVTVEDISCNGDGDGNVLVNATGGTEAYVFSLDGITYVPSPSFTGLGAGDYDVYVQDANNCQFEILDAGTIIEPEVLGATASATDVLCNGDSNGEIEVNVTGGTAGYMFSTGGAPSSDNPITGLDADSYVVTVTDAHGCEVVLPALDVNEPAELTISGLVANPIDENAGGNDPYNVNGGTSPYSYEWTDADDNVISTTQNLPSFTTAADAGTYNLTVTDDNGCSVTQSIIVNGIGELGQEYFITLYPNPTTGAFLINIAGMKGEKMSYNVVDANGRIVLAKELGNVNGTRTESVDMSGAAAGLYNVQFNIGTQVHSLRLMKN